MEKHIENITTLASDQKVPRSLWVKMQRESWSKTEMAAKSASIIQDLNQTCIVLGL